MSVSWSVLKELPRKRGGKGIELLNVKCEVSAPLVEANRIAVCLCERPKQHWLIRWCKFVEELPVCMNISNMRSV